MVECTGPNTQGLPPPGDQPTRAISAKIRMSCSHSHSCTSHSHAPSALNSLWKYVALESVAALNTHIPAGAGSNSIARRVLKPFDERLSATPVMSDDGPELIWNVEFTAIVKIVAIEIYTAAGDGAADAPDVLHLYANPAEPVDFDALNAGLKPSQTVMLLKQEEYAPYGDVVSYQINVPKFAQTRSISLVFPSNFSNGPAGSGDTRTRVDYIGFKGEFMSERREGIFTGVYELKPNPADHQKVGGDELMGGNVGF